MRVNRRNVLLAGGGAAASVASGLAPRPAAAQTPAGSVHWDREADVIVVGAGAAGTVAAIVAKETGNSVILLEAQPHTGGHAICSGGNVPLGGGETAGGFSMHGVARALTQGFIAGKYAASEQIRS
jgi:hypothetical protein